LKAKNTPWNIIDLDDNDLEEVEDNLQPTQFQYKKEVHAKQITMPIKRHI
jgi:hypothetical protein